MSSVKACKSTSHHRSHPCDSAGMSDFADRLRKWRERTQLKQKAAAERLGIDQSYLSKLEKGTRAPSFELVLRLAHLDGGPATPVAVAEPRVAYGRTFEREAPAGVVVHKSLTFPGDRFVYDRDSTPSEGDWILAHDGHEEREARVAVHPIDGQLYAWFVRGDSAPLDDVQVSAVAIEWRRPMKQP